MVGLEATIVDANPKTPKINERGVAIRHTPQRKPLAQLRTRNSFSLTFFQYSLKPLIAKKPIGIPSFG